MEKENRKSRAHNFTEREERILFNCIKKYKDVVECKKTDSISSDKKLKCWKTIAVEFNQQNDRHREVIILKNKWENLKKKSKKIISEEKTFRCGTGGGPPKYFKVTDIDVEIKEMLGKQVMGRTSYFDSEDHPLSCSDKNQENDVMFVQIMENENDTLPFKDTANEHHESDEDKRHSEETVRAQNNLSSETEDISTENDLFRPGVNFTAANLRKPKSDVLKVKNSQPDSRAKKHDVLKTNLGQWALSKITLVELQKRHLEEEHEKKMCHLDKKQKLELAYMKEEHEARIAKILNSGNEH